MDKKEDFFGKKADALGEKKWNHAPAPKFPGRRELGCENLSELFPLIDWDYFYLAWKIKRDSSEALELRRDAERELDFIERENICKPRGVISFFPVRRKKDSLEVFPENSDGSKENVSPLAMLHFLRMQEASLEPLRSIADYFSPYEMDWIGLFALSASFGIEAFAQDVEKLDPYRAILLRTLAVRLTEAYSEKIHLEVMKKWWGYSPKNNSGIRPVPGYPTTPDHSELSTIWKLLRPESIGMCLTESLMMIPEASISGYYVPHPSARYFQIRRIGEDQLKDYAERKGWSLEWAKEKLARLL